LSNDHLEEQLITFKNRLNQPLQYTEEVRLLHYIQELNNNISIKQSFIDFNESVQKYVNEYKDMLNCTIKDSFIKKKQAVSTIQSKKNQCVDLYIKEIKMYNALLFYLPKFTDEQKINQLCDECNIEFEIYDNMLICPMCSCEKQNSYQEESVSFKDLSRINTNIKYSYIRQTHFKDTMKQFQGKQNKYIDVSVYKILTNCFDNIGLHQVDHKGKYTQITKDHIKMFLQENNLCKYYEDINLIYSEITGNLCPDISNYEKVLMEDFEKLLVVYDKVIKDSQSQYDRSSFLNSYYVLYQLLKKNGYSCRETDFPIIKTIDRKIEHDDIYEKCCSLLGWKFYSTV
jgi:hypothetical protein